MEETYRASHGEGMRSFHALSEYIDLQNLHLFTDLEALRMPSFWVFMEESFQRLDDKIMVRHWC